MEEMERQQFTFYRSFYEALKNLPSRDRLAVYDAVCAYALDGTEPAVTGVAATVFTLIRPVLDTGRKRARTGKQGGKSDKANAKQKESKSEANGEQDESQPEAGTKQTAREKEEEKEKEGEIEKEIENECSKRNQKEKRSAGARFIPPTVEEVTAYVRERGSGVDPQRFVDFYASKGWVVGKSPMKDWRAAVRNWERERRDDAPRDLKHTAPDAEELARMQRLREKLRGEQP